MLERKTRKTAAASTDLDVAHALPGPTAAERTTVGLRELRQHASDLVRQVEAGGEVTITVAGRPSARLVPITGPQRWQTFEGIADIFVGAPDRGWEADRDLTDQQLRDPWDEA